MTAPADTLPAARTDAELIALFRRRRQELGLSHLALDARVGWGSGQVSKYEIPHGRAASGKRWGRWATLPALAEWAAGLGCAVALVPLDQIDSGPKQLSFAFVDDAPEPPARPPKKPAHHVHHIGNVNPEQRRQEADAAA